MSDPPWKCSKSIGSDAISGQRRVQMSKKRQVFRESEKACFTGHCLFQWMARAWPGRRRPRAVHMQSRDASDPPFRARGLPSIGRATTSAPSFENASKTLGVMRFPADGASKCQKNDRFFEEVKMLASRNTVFFNGWRALGRAEGAREPSTCSRGTPPTPPFGPEGPKYWQGQYLGALL